MKKTKTKLMIGLFSGILVLTGLFSAKGMNQAEAVSSGDSWDSITCEIIGVDGYGICVNLLDKGHAISLKKSDGKEGDVLNILLKNDKIVSIDKLGTVKDGLFTSVSADDAEVNEATTSDTVQLDVFYMYSNESGAFLLDPAAKIENVIFVEFEDLKQWDIDVNELSHGNILVGTFDETGWELLGLEYVK